MHLFRSGSHTVCRAPTRSTRFVSSHRAESDAAPLRSARVVGLCLCVLLSAGCGRLGFGVLDRSGSDLPDPQPPEQAAADAAVLPPEVMADAAVPDAAVQWDDAGMPEPQEVLDAGPVVDDPLHGGPPDEPLDGGPPDEPPTDASTGSGEVLTLPYCDSFEDPDLVPWTIVNLQQGEARYTTQHGSGAVEAFANPPGQGFVELGPLPDHLGVLTVRARFKVPDDHQVRNYDILQLTESGLGSAGLGVSVIGARFALGRLPDAGGVGGSVFYTKGVWFDLVLDVMPNQVRVRIDDQTPIIMDLDNPAELLRTLRVGVMNADFDQVDAHVFVDDVRVGDPSLCP